MAGGIRSQSQLHSVHDTGWDCHQLPLLRAPQNCQAEDGNHPWKETRKKMGTPQEGQEEARDSPQEDNEEVRNSSYQETILSRRSAVSGLLLNWIGSWHMAVCFPWHQALGEQVLLLKRDEPDWWARSCPGKLRRGGKYLVLHTYTLLHLFPRDVNSLHKAGWHIQPHAEFHLLKKCY